VAVTYQYKENDHAYDEGSRRPEHTVDNSRKYDYVNEGKAPVVRIIKTLKGCVGVVQLDKLKD